MSRSDALNRRAFLRNAGLTALAGAVGTSSPLAGVAAAAAADHAFVPPPGGKFDFDTPVNRFGSDCVKYDQQLRNFGPNSIDVGMGIADMDFRVAPAIQQALVDRVKHDVWGYIDMPADFAQGIIDWNKRKYGVTIKPEELVLSDGVHPPLIAALKALSPKGSRVLLQTPTYNGFWSDLTASQTVAEESPMKVVNGTYSMDFDDFESRIGPDTYAFILCNPQNPTGNCWSQDDLMRVGEICLKRRVVVLADEIHCDFVMKGQKYTPFASLPDKRIVDNSITFKAASKSFGLAAHKIGWFHSTNPTLLNRVKVEHRADLNSLGIYANRAAYQGGEDWLAQCVDYIDGNFDYAVDFIAKNIPMIKAVKGQGTYLLWLDCGAVAQKINTKQLAEDHNRNKAKDAPTLKPEQMLERWFVKYARVHMNQGASYGKGGEDHLRMNIATSRKTLEKALTNIANALKPATLSTAL